MADTLYCYAVTEETESESKTVMLTLDPSQAEEEFTKYRPSFGQCVVMYRHPLGLRAPHGIERLKWREAHG